MGKAGQYIAHIMLRNLTQLLGHELRCRADLTVGRAEDLLVEEGSWALRYLLAYIEVEPVRRHVLLPIAAFPPLAPETHHFDACLTPDELSHGPPVGPPETITREVEAALHDQLHWAPYWLPSESREHPRLRACRGLLTFTVGCAKGDIGRLDDLVIDASTWRVVALRIDAHKSLGRRHVYLPTAALREESHGTRQLSAAVSFDRVSSCPQAEGGVLDSELLARIERHLAPNPA